MQPTEGFNFEIRKYLFAIGDRCLYEFLLQPSLGMSPAVAGFYFDSDFIPREWGSLTPDLGVIGGFPCQLARFAECELKTFTLPIVRLGCFSH
ncbi:hypothetical protein [Parendozoicomonas haliclonae]|uniref:Uncharacterized protein n=1 Tax=Parendozoicomonas haliclonae TaxID=1960125 RepID=A0A1X7AEY3_9GAMM|nr:hypothetical protein [Parendozoicomonas haliclonae]SMA33510.1 hypothetical protein EHSB41UT_00292 [Parendozoicomonas haliclonae]